MASFSNKTAKKINSTNNVCPPLSQWTYKNGAYLDVDGNAVLNSPTSEIESPFIPVDYVAAFNFTFEAMGETAGGTSVSGNADGTKAAYHYNIKYYDSNQVLTTNSLETTGNGEAKITGVPFAWSSRINTVWNAGIRVRYAKIFFVVAGGYASSIYKVKKPMVSKDVSKTIFEPNILTNRPTKKHSKNLIKSLTNNDWNFSLSAPYTIVNDYKLIWNKTTSNWQQATIKFPVKPNKIYTFSGKTSLANYSLRLDGFKVGGGATNPSVFVNGSTVWATDINGIKYFTFTTPFECVEAMLFIQTNQIGNHTFEDFKIEEGSVFTAFNPYREVNRPAVKGKRMNGYSGYVQLPSMTMDSIEIDCLVDASQNTMYPYFFNLSDARAYKYDNQTIGNMVNVSKVDVNGNEYTVLSTGRIPLNQRAKFKFDLSAQKTGEAFIFSQTASAERMKGILYGIKCYLNGQVVYSVDYDKNKPKVSLPKAAKLKYPFNFERQSTEILNEVQYGVNIPRLKDGGVLVEEGTVNVYAGDAANTGAMFSLVSDDVWHKHTNISGGYKTANSSAGARFAVPLASLVNGQTYTASAIVYNPMDVPVEVHCDWCDLNDPTGIAKPTNFYTLSPKEEKRISASGSMATYNSTYRFFDVCVQGDGNQAWIKKGTIQVEQKDYATSYTKGERKLEKAYYPSPFDIQSGSIESVFDFSRLSTSVTQHLFDAYTSRWYFRVNGSSNDWHISIGGTDYIIPNVSMLPNNNVLKINYSSAGQLTVLLNGEVIYSNSNMNVIGAPANFYIGSHFQFKEYWGSSIKSFIVKDRNGNETFKF